MTAERPTLGDHVRETVTGWEGIVTGELRYLWGCEQVLVRKRGEDGEGDQGAEWFDIGRVEGVERAVLAPIVYAEVSSGPDKAAPIR